MKKEHFYKRAKVKGIRKCFVEILDYYENSNTYKCRTRFGTIRMYDKKELEGFTK